MMDIFPKVLNIESVYFSNSIGSYAIKVETLYHDNDLILTPILSSQSG